MNKTDIIRWKELLANNKSNVVLKELSKYYSGNEIFILRNRWRDLNEEKIKGTISQENLQLRKNKLIDDILDLLEKIEYAESESKPNIESELKPNIEFESKSTKVKLLGGFGLFVVLLLVGVWFFLQEENTKSEPSSNSQEIPSGPWSQSTIDSFYQNCMTSSLKNKALDSEVYCSCLLDLVKDRYRPGEATKAVKENAAEATACLRSALEHK